MRCALLLALAACAPDGGSTRVPGPDGDADADTDTDADTDADTDTDTDADSDADTDTDTDTDVAGPPDNPFGMGLVVPGDGTQLDLTRDLVGAGGGVRLTFPGMHRDLHDAPADWKAAVQGAYDRDLVPVVRLGPSWGDRRVRHQADDPGTYSNYTGLATAYADVVSSLPKRDGWPLYIEVHNEPNLCYEWVCDAGTGDQDGGGWISYQQTAAEYAHLLVDVADALDGLGDARVKVVNAGLAPGGTVSCQCGGEGWTPGITSREFLSAMKSAEPTVFSRLDAFASHPYPAQGEGWGFFVGYEGPGGEAETGLRYYESELETIGVDLPVILTETGWNTDHGGRDDIARWTVNAYEHVWLDDERIAYVLPFMLMDGSWDAFAWVSTSGAPYPVYGAVREQRIAEGL